MLDDTGCLRVLEDLPHPLLARGDLSRSERLFEKIASSIEAEDLQYVVAQVAALRGVGEGHVPTFAGASLKR
jgi:hypothetical protein